MSSQVLIQSIGEISLPRIGFRRIGILGLVLSALLLIFYIFQVSELTQASFFSVQYEKEIASLLQTNKSLEASLSRGNSLDNLEALLSTLDFQKVEKIHYIRIIDSQVAVSQLR